MIQVLTDLCLFNEVSTFLKKQLYHLKMINILQKKPDAYRIVWFLTLKIFFQENKNRKKNLFFNQSDTNQRFSFKHRTVL